MHYYRKTLTTIFLFLITKLVVISKYNINENIFEMVVILLIVFNFEKIMQL